MTNTDRLNILTILLMLFLGSTALYFTTKETPYEKCEKTETCGEVK